jgi:hypothetical protein
MVVAMTSEEAKAKMEREVFLEFIQMVGLPAVPGSVESRKPREPDILCHLLGGEQVAFELLEIVDQDVARMVSEAVRGREVSGVWHGDPTLDKVREKLIEKRYETPHPKELLAYRNVMLTPPDVWMPMFEVRLKELLDRSTFRRIWVVNLTPRGDERGVWLVHPPASP